MAARKGLFLGVWQTRSLPFRKHLIQERVQLQFRADSSPRNIFRGSGFPSPVTFVSSRVIALPHNASPVITSIAFNISDTRPHSNPASQSDQNSQGRLSKGLSPSSCRTCTAY